MKPLVIDLYAGLGGWAEGFLAEGYDVVGFDIERHDYGTGGYPGQLVLQDVRTLHGAQFKDAAVIVASPPCQEFSYRAMPWKRAKALGPPVLGIELFWQCWRIQHEAGDIPLIVENVIGAQCWVGQSRFIYGSFHLWGDLPALMPDAKGGVMKEGVAHRVAHRTNGETNFHGSAARAVRAGIKRPGMNRSDRNNPDRMFNDARKVPSDSGRRTDPGKGARFTSRDCGSEKGFARKWRDSPNGMPMMSSKSSARKAASAQIAKIPFPLAQHIARVFKPRGERPDRPEVQTNSVVANT